MIVDRFLTILADRHELREIHYRLRYKVFCEETGFEDARRFPDGKETDRYDRYAVHFLVWDRMESEWAGAMRLVDASKTRLPSETICRQDLGDLDEHRQRSAEFSRLCILSNYRHTRSATIFGSCAPDDAPNGTPHSVFFRQEDNEVFLRLLQASVAWGKTNGVDYFYFVLNAALARVLTRVGVALAVVGDPVEHRGTRVPQRCNVREAEEGLTNTLSAYRRMAQSNPAWVDYSDFLAGRTWHCSNANSAIPPQVYGRSVSPSPSAGPAFSRTRLNGKIVPPQGIPV